MHMNVAFYVRNVWFGGFVLASGTVLLCGLLAGIVVLWEGLQQPLFLSPGVPQIVQSGPTTDVAETRPAAGFSSCLRSAC
jgi:hypothetical protein